MIEAEAHEGKPAAEGCDGLAEDGILLALQLRDQSGDGELPAWLMPPEETNWLIRLWMLCPPSAVSAATGMLKRLNTSGTCSPMLLA